MTPVTAPGVCRLFKGDRFGIGEDLAPAMKSATLPAYQPTQPGYRRARSSLCRRRRAGPHLHQFGEDPGPGVELIQGAIFIAGGKLQRLAGLDAAGALVGRARAVAKVGIGRNCARRRKSRRLCERRCLGRQGCCQRDEAGECEKDGEVAEARHNRPLLQEDGGPRTG